MIIDIKKNNRGITLFEMLLTIVLISIAILIGFSSFDQYSKMQNAKIAANQVAFVLKKGRYYARTKGYPTKLVFTSGSRNYSLVSNGKNLVNSDNFDSSSGLLPGKTVIVSNSCGSIYFYIDGSMVDSNNLPVSGICSIKVGYSSGPQEVIRLEPQTGNIIYG